jgi:putative chitinase
MLLRIGSNGDDVKKVQAKLGINADGIFGPGTEKAVKAWQTANGLSADGIIGIITFGEMFSSASSDANSQTVAFIKGMSLEGFDFTKLASLIPADVVDQIPDCAAKFDINTDLRLAHFLAQCSHESAGFTRTVENLNYSVDGLKNTFNKYFPDNLAVSYAKDQEKIASRVYASRMGNGDEASKEGYKYRGRGFIQLTGKDNYSQLDESVDEDIVNNPDLVSSQYALLSAAWFWNSRRLNALADNGASDDVVTQITIKVNGGTNGLDDRIEHFNHYYALFV